MEKDRDSSIPGVLMMGVGILLITVLVWIVYIHPAQKQEHRQEEFLASLTINRLTVTPTISPTKFSANTTAATASTTSTVTSTSMPTPTIMPVAGNYLLEIPAIGLSWTVHEAEVISLNQPLGIAKTEMDEWGAVWSAWFAWPGEKGVHVVAGHRDGFGFPFFYFDRIRPGDLIRVTRSDGNIYEYITDEIREVEPDDETVLYPIHEDRREIRLITCLVGSMAKRVVVFATVP